MPSSMILPRVALTSVIFVTAVSAAPWRGNSQWQPKGMDVWRGEEYGGNLQCGKHTHIPSRSYGADSETKTSKLPGNETSPGLPAIPSNGTASTPKGSTCAIAEDTWCLSKVQVEQASDVFRTLIQEYSDEFALETLTEDFVDWTSAVNIIRNRGNDYPFVVNEVTFDSRAEFMAAQGAQPQIPFDTLNVFAGCETTTTRWQTLRSGNGQATESNDIPVVGLAVVKAVPADDNSLGFRVKELYSEFNAAAWLVNNGVFTPSAVTTSNLPAATANANVRRKLPNVGMI